MDMGSCWKNSGQPCDGDVTTDVTRYSEMIINPETEAWCRPDRRYECPPYHTFKNGTRVSRNDRVNFPYDAYHVYCSPGNAKYAEQPTTYCDPYSNPQPQEIMQVLPHPVWGEYGYPTKKGDGWIGDPRTWELDVGGLSHNLYFYQVIFLIQKLFILQLFIIFSVFILLCYNKCFFLHIFAYFFKGSGTNNPCIFEYFFKYKTHELGISPTKLRD